MDLFGGLLNYIVSNIYYGMVERQISMCLLPKYAVIETIEFKMVAVCIMQELTSRESNLVVLVPLYRQGEKSNLTPATIKLNGK